MDNNMTQVTDNSSWESGLHKTDNQDSNRLGDELVDRKENEEELGYEESKEPFRRGSRPHSTPMTLRWLEENYETAEGVCIPRSTLYVHYLDFCEENDTNPVNAASFGKIIRQQFPQITTRRLGTRGQSKYHYYGIGVKESSAYYDVMYSAKGVQTLGEGKKDTTKQIVAYSPRSKLGTLLPPFPDVKDLNLPVDVDEQKVVTFVMMYRTHCQRILDTVIRANFDEVQNFLHHFWQGMPPHITPILGTQTLIHLVGACDSILYKAVANVLMPTVLQPFPESLTQVIRQFASQLEDWLTNALSGMPSGLQDLKLDLSRRFSQVLRRQLSVNHLVQAARTVVNSPDVMSQMLSDWLMVDIGGIVQQTLYTMDEYVDKDTVAIFNFCTDFEKLLDEQAPLESYVDWLDAMIKSCVVKPSGESPSSLKTVSRQFLFLWTCFGTRVIRDLTLQSAASFGSFHLLHLMLDDYVLYRIECLQADHRANSLLAKAKGQADDPTPVDDVILPDSSQVPLPIGPFITSPVPRYGPAGLFDEHMLDYESNSDCFSSDEEGEDDEEDEAFLRSPFDALGGMNGQPLQSVPSSYHVALPPAHAGSFLGNSNMKASDHHHQPQHHHQPHQHPFTFPGSGHHSDFSAPVPHHDNFFFPPQHRSAIDQHANSLQLQQHPHQHPHHQQLHHRQAIIQNVPHNPQYGSKPVPASRSVGFSTSEVPGIPTINFYPGQFSTLPPRDLSHESSNLSETLALPVEAMERKAMPYTPQVSAHPSHGTPHNNLESCRHGYNAPASILLSEVPPSFPGEERGGPAGLKRKHDVTDKMEGLVREAVTTPNVLVKESLWSPSQAATSFIN